MNSGSPDRLNFAVESFRGLNNRASNFANRALNMFEIQAQLFQELSEMTKNSLVDRIPRDLQCVNGIPGTQFDALGQISNLFANFLSHSNFVEQETSQSISASKNEYSSSSTQMNDYLTDMCSNSHQIISIKNSIRDNKSHLPSKFSKYNKSINNIVSLKTKVKKSSDVVHLYEKILKIRNESDIYRRSNFVYAAERCMGGITQNSDNAIQLLKQQFQNQKSILSSITQSNQQIIDKCNETSDFVFRTMNIINFQRDFTNYINTYKIIRYDLLPTEFKALDFNHECFSNIPTFSCVLSLQIYPYAMAKTKKEFNAKDRNEITLQKGKIVLLMEDLSLSWVFVQNPITKVMGYAPSSFLEVIGNGLGVLLEEVTTNEELLSKGDYVALEGDCGAGVKLIHTISDGTAQIPMSIIGIISEI